jgi:hypothetical protein
VALDRCHQQVVRALEKDGWMVAKKPTKLYSEDRQVFIDILAERGTNGSQEQIILSEVKCFPDRNDTTREIYIAFGQYLVYRAIIAELKRQIPLYLAVPEDAYQAIFDPVIQRVVNDNQVKLLVVDLEMEIITRWMA